MPVRRHILFAIGAVLALAALATMTPSCGTRAQGSSCSAGCKAAYGSCYKSSQDRARCQAQLQRCLEHCIRNKR